MIEVTEATMIALASGIGAGLVTWGGIRTEIRWLRRDMANQSKDIARAHTRIDHILAPEMNRRATDQ